MNLSKETIDKLVKDPSFKEVEEFITDFFKNSIDINSVDTKLSPDNVLAQVIAKQQIDKTIANLMSFFNSCREIKGNSNKISYK